MIFKECFAAGCRNDTSHVLTVRVMTIGEEPADNEIGYCHQDARYFAYWLVEVYTDEYEILNIRQVRQEEIRSLD